MMMGILLQSPIRLHSLALDILLVGVGVDYETSKGGKCFLVVFGHSRLVNIGELGIVLRIKQQLYSLYLILVIHGVYIEVA